MRHRRRLDRLRDRARAARTSRARAIRARLCVGLEPEEIMDLVVAAIRPEHLRVLEAGCPAHCSGFAQPRHVPAAHHRR